MIFPFPFFSTSPLPVSAAALVIASNGLWASPTVGRSNAAERMIRDLFMPWVIASEFAAQTGRPRGDVCGSRGTMPTRCATLAPRSLRPEAAPPRSARAPGPRSAAPDPGISAGPRGHELARPAGDAEDALLRVDTQGGGEHRAVHDEEVVHPVVAERAVDHRGLRVGAHRAATHLVRSGDPHPAGLPGSGIQRRVDLPLLPDANRPAVE